MTEIGLKMPQPWCGPVPAGEDIVADGARLTDLSWNRRIGLKGPEAEAALRDLSIAVPERANRASFPNEAVVARLSTSEFLILATGEDGGALVEALSSPLADATHTRAYPVPRQDLSAWFHIEGRTMPRLMASLCAVDLRPENFQPGALAQTSVANQNAIVLRHDLGIAPGVSLIVDYTCGAYLWRMLQRAVMDLDRPDLR